MHPVWQTKLHHLLFRIKKQPSNSAMCVFAVHQSLPLHKGGGPPLGGSEGLCGRHLHNCNTSAKSYCGNNPSVSFADSSLYTREPWVLPHQCIILTNPTYEQIIGRINCFTNTTHRAAAFLRYFPSLPSFLSLLRSSLVLKCRSKPGSISRQTSAAVKPPLYRHIPPWSCGTVVTIQKCIIAATKP